MNGISHDIAGAALPEMFCVALTWDTASPERATVTETLGNVSTALDLAKVFEKMPAGGRNIGCEASCATTGSTTPRSP